MAKGYRHPNLSRIPHKGSLVKRNIKRQLDAFTDNEPIPDKEYAPNTTMKYRYNAVFDITGEMTGMIGSSMGLFTLVSNTPLTPNEYRNALQNHIREKYKDSTLIRRFSVSLEGLFINPNIEIGAKEA